MIPARFVPSAGRETDARFRQPTSGREEKFPGDPSLSSAMTSLGEIRWSEHPEWHDATVALPPPGYRLLDAGSSMLRPARVPHVYTSYSPPEDGFHLRLSSAPPTPTLYNSILGWPIPTQMNPAEMARVNDDFLQDAVPPVDYGRYYGVPFGQVSPSGSHELEVDSAEEAAQLPQVSDSETMPIRVGVTVRPGSYSFDMRATRADD